MAKRVKGNRQTSAGDERCRFRPLQGNGLRMVLRLTMRCDLACPHCLAATQAPHAELTSRQWQTLMAQFPDIGVRKVLLTGGEPLLRDDLLDLVQALSRLNIRSDLNSNLQRMQPSMMSALKHAGLSEISVSLEGPEGIHDRMHGRAGAYAKLVAAIGWAAANDIPVDASCCLTKDNFRHIRDLIRIVLVLPVRSLTFSRLLPVGHGRGTAQALSQEELDGCDQMIRHEIDSGLALPVRITGLLGAPRPEDCERGKSLVAMTSEGHLLGCVLSQDNPDIPHPLEIGLPLALTHLRDKLNQREYAFCWREGA